MAWFMLLIAGLFETAWSASAAPRMGSIALIVVGIAGLCFTGGEACPLHLTKP